MRTLFISFILSLCAFVQTAGAQAVTTFGGNAQHTSVYQPPAQDLSRIRWSTSIDQNNVSYAHYGAPLVTAGNTVIYPVKTASGFFLEAKNGGDGATKYSLTTDYIRPTSSWVTSARFLRDYILDCTVRVA